MKYSFFLPPPSTHMYTAAPSAPKDYSILLDQPFIQTNNSATVAFNFTSNSMFNINYAITAYRIRHLHSTNKDISLATSLMECPPFCSPDEPCQCTGLEMGERVTVAISAINCGNQEGLAIEVTVTTCKSSNTQITNIVHNSKQNEVIIESHPVELWWWWYMIHGS